ncbi:MAG: Type 1 glutamine amidotransferase-like domain-containing protein [Deltaproteobacteria bacterium]|nr:Type 1 glutamine amidotransferase-like domain-containing protein [Deltaproteobacteria bacterium]
MREDVHGFYASINAQLVRGGKLHFRDAGSGRSELSENGVGGRLLRYPKIGIYAGAGTSHSWLWFVEAFDLMGFHDLDFLDEARLRSGGLKDLDVLAVSGGDTFAVAEALGEEGARRIEAFVRRGGLYIGSCAGAYLPLRSSKTPLNLFNYVNVKIANLAKTLPEPTRMAYKFCTAYGCDFVFHPVREEVILRVNGVSQFRGPHRIAAPMYGGPSMTATQEVEVLAYYEDFSDKTLFLVDETVARDTLIDRAAVVRSRMGEGAFVLFGPHFEHPHYPEANGRLADIIFRDMRKAPVNTAEPTEGRAFLGDRERSALLKDLKRELSNSRIVSVGLEILPIRWRIGAKVYEPEKIRVFLESMWNRVRVLEKSRHMIGRAGEHEPLIRAAGRTTELLRSMKRRIDLNEETTEHAEELFRLLHVYATLFLELYFRSVSHDRGLPRRM